MTVGANSGRKMKKTLLVVEGSTTGGSGVLPSSSPLKSAEKNK